MRCTFIFWQTHVTMLCFYFLYLMLFWLMLCYWFGLTYDSVSMTYVDGQSSIILKAIIRESIHTARHTALVTWRVNFIWFRTRHTAFQAGRNFLRRIENVFESNLSAAFLQCIRIWSAKSSYWWCYRYSRYGLYFFS